MIEIICNGDDEAKEKNEKNEKNTAIRRPKNIKQIGDVSSDISYKCFSRYTASACATVAAPPDIITCFNSVSFSTVTYSFPRYAS